MIKIIEKPNNKKIANKIKLTTMVAVLTASGNAFSGFPVVDGAHIAATTAQTTALMGILTPWFATFQTYGVTGSPYMIQKFGVIGSSADIPGAGGVIPNALSNIHSAIERSAGITSQAAKTATEQQMQRHEFDFVKEGTLKVQADMQTACSEAGMAKVRVIPPSAAGAPGNKRAGRPPSGGGGGGDQRVKTDSDKITTATSVESEMANQLLKKSENGYCMSSDVARKVAGCEGKTVTAYAGADINPDSFIRTAKNINSEGSNKYNYSIQEDSDDEKAANTARENFSAPISPAVLPSGLGKTPQGLEYDALRNTVITKQAAAQNSTKSIMSWSVAPKSAAGLGDRWKFAAEHYTKVFPHLLMPVIPSKREMMHYDANWRYLDGDWITDMAGKDEKTIAYETLMTQAAALSLQYTMLERMEAQNNLLVAILDTQINPVTIADLEARRKQVVAVGKK